MHNPDVTARYPAPGSTRHVPHSERAPSSTSTAFMAATVDSAALADTILRSATEGYYPDSESIATADLTHAHLPTILNALDAAKEDVKVHGTPPPRR